MPILLFVHRKPGEARPLCQVHTATVSRGEVNPLLDDDVGHLSITGDADPRRHDVVPCLEGRGIEVLLEAGLARLPPSDRHPTSGDAEEAVRPLGYQPIGTTRQVCRSLPLVQAQQFGSIGRTGFALIPRAGYNRWALRRGGGTCETRNERDGLAVSHGPPK